MNKKQFLFKLSPTLLFVLSAVVLTIDFSPIDFIPAFQTKKKAIKYLEQNKNILDELPLNVTVKPGSNNMNIVTNSKVYKILISIIKNNSEFASRINWNHAVGVGYSSVNVPVGTYTLKAFNPLYIILQPFLDKNKFELIPVGYLQDLYKWIVISRQKWTNRCALILLIFGFLLQFIITKYSEERGIK